MHSSKGTLLNLALFAPAMAFGLTAWSAKPTSPGADYFIAHEWGTFTSVQGSNGLVLEGLQHEEEPLPDFVYGRSSSYLPTTSLPRDPWCPHPPHCPKAFEVALRSGTPTAVTQKLETPVIYFYSNKPKTVNVDVDFPNGIISQWYPNAKAFSPAIGNIRSLSDGTISWKIDLTNEKMEVPAVDAASTWAPSRQVNSMYVKAGQESEKFIFYRGLGRFNVPLEIKSRGEELDLANNSAQIVPNAFLIKVTDDGGSIRSIGALPANSHVKFSFTKVARIEAKKIYLKKVSSLLQAALVDSGLYADESKAMVDTWSRSYFLTTGTRVLYIVPRAWTDKILPLRITPEPQNLVRTLVGRVEILTTDDEAILVSNLRNDAASHSSMSAKQGDRFSEPRLHRAAELTEDADVRAYAEKLLQTMN